MRWDDVDALPARTREKLYVPRQEWLRLSATHAIRARVAPIVDRCITQPYPETKTRIDFGGLEHLLDPGGRDDLLLADFSQIEDRESYREPAARGGLQAAEGSGHGARG